MNKQQLINKLFDIGGIKFGNFTLKSGIQSPIYIDLRVTISYPEVLQTIADAMWNQIRNLDFDLICGVPYTALPIATAMTLKYNKPMLMRRKEVKNHGTRRAIEGSFIPGQRCIIVDDLVTNGTSVFETVAPLEQEGLEVTDIVVLLDREQGGKQHISDRGYTLHTVMTITELIKQLEQSGRIDPERGAKTLEFINNTNATV